MSRFVQLSEAASLAIHGMILMAEDSGGRRSVKEIALILNASEAHMAKVVQRLSKVGLVRTTRGPGGGVILGKKPDDISFLEIFEAIDGPLDQCPCMLNKEGPCPFESCVFSGVLEKATAQIKEKFANTRLSDYKKTKNNGTEGD